MFFLGICYTCLSMEKVAFIWPAYPYRWWIAHHTNQLCNAFLQEGYGLNLYNFSYLYPSFLYPGKNQLEPPGTKNPFSKGPNFFSHTRLLNPLNPVSWYRVAKNIFSFSPRYCVIRYWHPYFFPCFTFIAWFLHKRKIPVICIVDNIQMHEKWWGDTFFVKILFNYVDLVVTQSLQVHKEYQALHISKPEETIEHPLYDQFWSPVPQKESQAFLGLPKNQKILLFFGFIRPYKGLDILLESFSQLLYRDKTLHLVVAGECFWDFDKYQKIIHTHSLQKHCTLHIKYIPNELVRYYFCAADLVVLPYTSITNSWIEKISLAYAPQTLVTVNITSQELMKKISKKLSSPGKTVHPCNSWQDFVRKMNIFFDRNFVWDI